LRRLIVPLNYFMEKPFQNWTRQSGRLIGSVTLHVDFGAPVERIRAKVTEIVKDSPLWDADVVALQVTDATPSTMELRALVSGRSSAAVFDLRCLVRERRDRLPAGGASAGAAAAARGARSEGSGCCRHRSRRGAAGSCERSKHPRAVAPRLNDTGLPRLRHHVR